MNPMQEEPNTVPVGNAKPAPKPITYVAENSTPQTDLAALQAIGTLEAEEDTSSMPRATIPTQPFQPPAPVESTVDVMTPFVPEQPTIVAEDMPPVNTLQAGPAQTNSDPFPKQNKSMKKAILILIAATVLIGGIVVGYFVWQSMQANNQTETSESTNGSLPSGTVVDTPSDTQTTQNEN